jgi:hypothetical protein
MQIPNLHKARFVAGNASRDLGEVVLTGLGVLLGDDSLLVA